MGRRLAETPAENGLGIFLTIEDRPPSTALSPSRSGDERNGDDDNDGGVDTWGGDDLSAIPPCLCDVALRENVKAELERARWRRNYNNGNDDNGIGLLFSLEDFDDPSVALPWEEGGGDGGGQWAAAPSASAAAAAAPASTSLSARRLANGRSDRRRRRGDAHDGRGSNGSSDGTTNDRRGEDEHGFGAFLHIAPSSSSGSGDCSDKKKPEPDVAHSSARSSAAEFAPAASSAAAAAASASASATATAPATATDATVAAAVVGATAESAAAAWWQFNEPCDRVMVFGDAGERGSEQTTMFQVREEEGEALEEDSAPGGGGRRRTDVDVVQVTGRG